LARKEVTLYSDFEHVVVLEKSCQDLKNNWHILEYFRWYSVIFHVVVINLMETTLLSMDIPGIRSGSARNRAVFFYSFTRREISFDGMIPHAYKLIF